MKKFLSIIMILSLSFIGFFNNTAFASEVEEKSSLVENTIVPFGSLSGYGQHWYNSGENTVGDFYVQVTGRDSYSAQLTFKIENFDENVAVAVQVYRQNGSLAWGSLENLAAYITMENRDNWHNLPFLHAKTGRYRIHYSIRRWGGGTPSSGRINCWIY